MDLAQRIVEKLQKGFCVRQQTRRHFKEADPNRVTQINLQSLEDAIIGYALGQKSLGQKYFLCVSISITYFGQSVGHIFRFSLSQHIWTITERSQTKGCQISSESYDQQLSVFVWEGAGYF